jgi:hypothetical protein
MGAAGENGRAKVRRRLEEARKKIDEHGQEEGQCKPLQGGWGYGRRAAAGLPAVPVPGAQVDDPLPAPCIDRVHEPHHHPRRPPLPQPEPPNHPAAPAGRGCCCCC